MRMPSGSGLSRRIFAGLVVVLAAFTAPSVAMADEGTEQSPVATGNTEDEALQQTLDEHQGTATGQVVLEAGHTDIGPRWIDDTWTIAIHDDTQIPSVWRNPQDVSIRVRDAAQLAAPTGERYSFLGEAAGTTVYVIPQTQNRDVVWAGWNTQDPNVMSRLHLGATLTFYGVEGPGDLFVFLQSGTLGEPEVLWDSTRPGPQDLFVRTNTHTHANWVFTRPGVYLVDFEISGTLLSGEKVSDRAALRFAVGDETDPQAALDATFTPVAVERQDEQATEAPAGDEGTDWVLVTAIVVAVLLAAAAFAVVQRNARLKRRVAQEHVKDRAESP